MLKKYKYRYKKFPEIGAILISKMVLEKGLPPLFMYRENSLNSLGSGWRIFSGLESEEYTKDATNFTLCSAATMLKIDPSMEAVLLAGIGSVFERVDGNSAWYLVDDYKLDDDFIVEIEISPSWSFKINNLFEQELEEENTQYFTTGDKSVRILSWTTDFSKEQIAQDVEAIFRKRNKRRHKFVSHYDLSDNEIMRIGYRIKEKNRQKDYEVIYAYNFLNGHILQMAFYFDAPEDEAWALETWESVKLSF